MGLDADGGGPSTLYGRRRRRNNIRIHGSAGTHLATSDYDVKVFPLLPQGSYTTPRPPAKNSDTDLAKSKTNGYLESVGKTADVR